MPNSTFAFWNDPVWSKVIATFIWLIISGISTFVVGGMKRDKFPLLKILNIRLPSWILIILIILLSIANIIFPQFLIWSSMVILVAVFIISLIYYNRAYENKNVSDPANSAKETIYFSSQDAPVHSLTAFYEQDWVNKAPVGDKATGEFTFHNKIINIKRSNKDGRVIVKIERYKGDSPYYIKKNLNNNGKRFITINFDAKIVGGKHPIWIVIRHAGQHVWINNAFKIVQVTSENWEHFNALIPIPPTEDIEVHFEDRGIVNAGSSIQIKNFVISEPLD
jgi:hypothetical protein